MKFILFVFFSLSIFSCDEKDLSKEESIQGYVYNLADFGTRYYKSVGNDKSRDWIMEKMISFGYEATFLQSFTAIGQSCDNIISVKEGKLFSDKYIIIGAHYDTISEKPDEKAPGANDNGSGVAVLLDLAKRLKNVETDYSIKFIFWDAEEPGLYGSRYYVNDAKSKNESIVFYFNMDEIGGNSLSSNVIDCEEDKANVASQNLNKKVIHFMKQAGLSTISTDIDASDYIPFKQAGYTALGIYEDPTTPHYHRSTDEGKYVNFEYLGKVAEGVYNFILEEAK